MTDSKLRVTPEMLSPEEDRFDRFRRIGWWDQNRLTQAKVLVIGAGALGNELIKNLALLGIGHLFIVDLDRVENSNLSRSVLFRGSDNGAPKAEVAATAARSIYPQIQVHSFRGNVVHDLGLGVFRWADLVVGGLDNREARLAINRSCWKVNRPWIDGAIEQIQGWVRFFAPDGPCYECTMSERDWAILQQRRSCNLLTQGEMEGGRAPTTPTISSIIAGVQCQEAVKHLHGLQTLAGKGWIFEGLSGDSYGIEYQRKEDCQSHDMLDDVIELPFGHTELTGVDLLEIARQHLGPTAVLEFPREMLAKLVCPKCHSEEELFRSLSQVSAAQVWCPTCSGVRREVTTFFRLTGSEPFLTRSLAALGVPPFDILFASTDERLIGLELTKDASSVLGGLIGHEEDVEWA
ncbi:MAG TPA: ThiF family adenylyltransferase [Planctomicrobium sp.]|nr:ThiF family adenylyltransferase [Planctomicrobium sp.]